jgi:hypothetical protein
MDKYTVYEVADILKTSHTTIYNKLNNKDIYKELRNFIIRQAKVRYVSREGIEILKKYINFKESDNKLRSEPTFPRLTGGSLASVRRIALWGAPEQLQETNFPPEPFLMVSPTCLTAPSPPTKRGIGRTSPVGVRRVRCDIPAQHGAIGFGRRSSIIARMRRNSSRGTATSAIWNTVSRA